MTPTPQLNLTELLNDKVSGNLSINITKEMDNIIVNVNMSISDSSTLPLNFNNNVNGRYKFSGTAEEIQSQLTSELGLNVFIVI